MSDAVLLALINNIFTPVVLAVVAAFTVKQNSRMKRIQDQVENSHKNPDGTIINMREESDERHSQITGALKAIDTKMDSNTHKISALTTRLDKIEKRLYGKLSWMHRKA